jgi:MFS family permease
MSFREVISIILMLLNNNITQLPVLLVLIAGLFLTLKRWEQHPRALRLIALGLGIMLVGSIVGNLVSVWLPSTFAQQGLFTQEIAVRMVLVGFAFSLLYAVAWGMILLAIFGMVEDIGKRKRDGLTDGRHVVFGE